MSLTSKTDSEANDDSIMHTGYKKSQRQLSPQLKQSSVSIKFEAVMLICGEVQTKMCAVNTCKLVTLFIFILKPV
jgi:hypothetical protein